MLKKNLYNLNYIVPPVKYSWLPIATKEKPSVRRVRGKNFLQNVLLTRFGNFI